MALPLFRQRVDRWTVPAVISAAFAAAVIGGIFLPHSGRLPGAALGTEWVLYTLRSLAIFYGLLLLVVPVIRAFRGELPVELSTRGARYEEASATSKAIDDLVERIAAVEIRLTEVGELTAGAIERVAALEDASPIETIEPK
jgi:hypothetical protein